MQIITSYLNMYKTLFDKIVITSWQQAIEGQGVNMLCLHVRKQPKDHSVYKKVKLVSSAISQVHTHILGRNYSDKPIATKFPHDVVRHRFHSSQNMYSHGERTMIAPLCTSSNHVSTKLERLI